jgi:hypothetical protein
LQSVESHVLCRPHPVVVTVTCEMTLSPADIYQWWTAAAGNLLPGVQDTVVVQGAGGADDWRGAMGGGCGAGCMILAGT